MLTQSQSAYVINIMFHVVILFTFLTLLFFLYISKTTSKSINNALSKIIKSETSKILNNTENFMENHGKILEIDWDKLDKWVMREREEAMKDKSDIQKTNRELRNFGVKIVIGLFILLILTYLYYAYYLKYNIKLGCILYENFILFMFVGIIEYMFFTHIASSFIPVTPNFISESIISKIQEHINTTFY